MLFSRYRKQKRLDDSTSSTVPKKLGLTNVFLRKLPFARKSRSKTSNTDESGIISLPRHSLCLSNMTTENSSPVSCYQTRGIGSTTTYASKRQSCITSTNPTHSPHYQRQRQRHSLLFDHHVMIDKRHSIAPEFSKLTLDNNLNKDKQRHSYTFGKQQELKNLSLKDLVLDASQEKKLDLFLAQREASRPVCDTKQQQPTTTYNASSTHSLIVPQRSSSHQLLTSPKKLLLRAHSTSSSSIHQLQEDTTDYYHSPLDPATLCKMLEDNKQHEINNNNNSTIILIDVRHLVDYQRQRICGSVNVNLPSLLIKRYQRGTMSNFHLENFITTAEGRAHYLTQRQSCPSSPMIPTLPSISSKDITWVVYDDDMNEQYKSTQAWTLLNVLCKASLDTNDQVHFLTGGFSGFIADGNHDNRQWIEGTDSEIYQGNNVLNSTPRPLKNSSKDQLTLPSSTSSETPTMARKQRFGKVSPQHSTSYTVGDGTKIQQQTSLFSLDTQAARENNANALARRANRRSHQLQQQQQHQLSNQQQTLAGIDERNNNNNSADNAYTTQYDSLQQHNNNTNNSSTSLLSIPSLHSTTTAGSYHSSSSSSLASVSSFSVSPIIAPTQPQPQQLQQQQPLTTKNTLVSTTNSITTTTGGGPLLARVMEEEDNDDVLGQMTADISPRTETDFDFTISEIIPGFLYVGPEIETDEQADQLLALPIQRVLNMAEECQDRPLDHHRQQIIYRKIAARDTVEMRNIDNVMMEAVGFIEEAKRYHQAIYVHCKAGKSRSVTVILAYLISCEKWTLKQSYRHVIKARPTMSPNIGFIAELVKLENQVHGRVSSFMETDWHTAALPSPGFAHELQKLQLAWQQSPSTPTMPSHVLDPYSV